jgi:hypothetical protein
MVIFPTLRNVGLGLAAGLIGTLAMTLGQEAEMALTGRPPSKTPAEGAEKASGIDVSDEAAEQTLSNIVHFGYGTLLGAGLAALDDVPEPARTIAYFVGAQATGMAVLQALDLEGKPSKWDAPSAAIDVGHHLVYAVAAGLAYAGGKRLFAGR